ncbi:hypothetical protein K435DRAFT_966852 [Dendrothele bispora CBS 962.96]|uniref:Uncharacterized protein n=1 Tax=Dendrothele bispora (strain CBS 962.96) TaxID=1314807 RepID=A0A4S8LXI7_DENBC|nr:hypothetical protein K435DRAFT_966852 [Dendrothele bispora CBS 962.96]
MDTVTNYKGKGTNRGWAQLPDELIRTIASHYLWDLSSSKYCPDTWNIRPFWQCRMVFTALRDVADMEKFMMICPQWSQAVEYHHFWEHAVAVIDPRDTYVMQSFVQPPNLNANRAALGGGGGGGALGGGAAAAGHQKLIKLSPYRHFRQLLTWSCLVCRINNPQTSTGIGGARHSSYNNWLGHCGLCREHNGGPDRPSARDRPDRGDTGTHRERSSFCGLCLREAQPFELSYGGYGYMQPGMGMGIGMGMAAVDLEKTRRNPLFYAGCMENEDETTFSGVDTTCRTCRSEWLWKRINSVHELRRARDKDREVRDREREWERERERIRNAGGDPRQLGPLPLNNKNHIRFEAWDWDHEARSSYESFIELGEGTIEELIGVVRDRWWLRTRTKLGGMLEQAVAAERFLNNETTLPPVTSKPSRSRSSRAKAQPRPQVQSQTQDVDANGGASLVESESDLQLIETEVAEDNTDEEEEEEEEEEDTELLQLTEDSGVRDLALSDWVRRRILDGFWVNPADQWYGNFRIPVAPQGLGQWQTDAGIIAIHPCPWSIESEEASDVSSSPTASTGDPDSTQIVQPQPIHHPLPSTIFSPIPPSFPLCEEAYRAFGKEIRTLLLPGMCNLVRRIVIECHLASLALARSPLRSRMPNRSASPIVVDAAARASRMTLDDVVKELRECEGVWWEGWDWGRFPHSGERDKEEERKDGRGHQHGREASDKSTSSGPGSSPSTDESSTPTSTTSHPNSTMTSPVLSTSTLGTTPSPPPIVTGSESSKKTSLVPSSRPDEVRPEDQVSLEEAQSKPSPITIPISPVLDPPKMLRPIPYIPVSIAHLPGYSLDAIKSVWREACAPLYHCRCKICLRAAEKANAAAAAAAGNGVAQNTGYAQQQPQQQARERERVNEREGDKGDTEHIERADAQGTGNQLVQIKLDEVETEVEVGQRGDGEELDYASEEVEYDYSEDGEKYEYEFEDEEQEEGNERGVQRGETADEGEEEDREAILKAYRRSRERDRYTRSRSPEVPPQRWTREKERERELRTPLPLNTQQTRPRKRSCDEVDGVGDTMHSGGDGIPKTPPKRMRKESPEPSSPVATTQTKGLTLHPTPSPTRKRGSEELELEDERGNESSYEKNSIRGVVGSDGDVPSSPEERRHKRFKTSSEEEDGDVEVESTPPRSLTAESERCESVTPEERERRAVEVNV